MHLGSWESTREARKALDFASGHSNASLVLSQLPACIHNSIDVRQGMDHFLIRKTTRQRVLPFLTVKVDKEKLILQTKAKRCIMKKMSVKLCKANHLCQLSINNFSTFILIFLPLLPGFWVSMTCVERLPLRRIFFKMDKLIFFRLA